MVKGVRPLAAIPTTTSFRPGFFFASSRWPRPAGIFVGFESGSQRRRTAGHDELNSFAIDIEGGRALGGVERREASAGAGTHIDEPAATAQAIGDEVNGARDLRKSTPHGTRDFGIFAIEDLRDFQR